MKTKLINLTFILVVSFCSGLSSQNLENIIIPYPGENKGIIPQDMIITDEIFTSETNIDFGLVFIYSMREILVYNNEMNYLYKIPLSDFSRNNERYSELDRIPSISYMSFNAADKELYYINPTPSEEVKIYYTKFGDNGNVIDSGTAYVAFAGSTGDLFNLGGYTVLKFNETTKRIYFIINGTGIDNINSYFGIYKRGTNFIPDFNFIYEEINFNEVDFYDVAFNPENDGISDDFFFLSIDNFWKIYKIDQSGVYVVDERTLGDPNQATIKNGWFLTLYKQNSYNKILCLPHNDHYANYGNHTVWEIDCSNITPQFNETEIPLPPSMVFNSGAINLNTNLVILCAKPTEVNEDMLYYFDANNSNTGIISGTDPGVDLLNLGTYMICYDNTYVLARKNNIESFQCQNTFPVQISSTNNILTKQNNYFAKPVINSNSSNESKLLVLNLLGSGLERFNKSGASYTPPSPFGVSLIQTGYAVYESVVNSINKKIYFYSCSDHNPTSVFVVNSSDNSISKLDFNHSIGDIIHNPYTNELLVSEYGSNVNEIVVLDSEGTQSKTITIDDNYIEAMFIADNGFLYVSSGMNYDDLNPQINIFDATTSEYAPVSTIEIQNMVNNQGKARLKAGFENNGKGGVFGFISIVSVTATDISENASKGLFFDIDEALNITYYSDDENYRKVIFEEGSEKIYLLTEGDIFSLDYSPNSGTPFTNRETVLLPDGMNSISAAIDMDYDITSGQCYFAATDNSSNNVLWTVIGTEATPIITYQGDEFEIISIYFNSLNLNLYAYLIPRDGKETERYSSLLWYDQVSREQGSLALNDTQNNLVNGCLPDTKDDGYIYYNRNKIVNVPGSLKLYITNGMQSNISSIDLDYEYLNLGSDIRWLSFPRLENTAPQGEPQMTYAPYAMNNRINPQNFVQGELRYYDGDDGFLTWDNVENEWIPQSGSAIIDIFSKNGYKLDLYDGEQRWLKLTGTIEDAGLQFELEGERENWVGYYLTHSQSPFDAISDEHLEEISLIKGQFWTCVHTWCDNNQSPCWICAVAKGVDEPVLNYGDMVVLQTFEQDIVDFQWQESGTKHLSADQRNETVFYSYTEQPDYTPLFIELDTNNNPLEIGAFVENTCVGATSVFPEDTIIMITAYTEGITGELYFQQFYGNTKASTQIQTNYFVKNNTNGTFQNRTISTRENEPFYLISLKNKDYNSAVRQFDDQPAISCYPNPSNGRFNIYYTITGDHPVSISINLTNLYGNTIRELQKGELAPGEYSLEVDSLKEQDGKLPGGIYVIEIRMGKLTKYCKIVVL